MNTKEQKTYSLYYLKHPITREIRYVGLTSNPKRRFRDHRRNSKTKSCRDYNLPVYHWWRKVVSETGLEPVMTIYKTGLTKEEGQQAEKDFIAFCREHSDNLLNIFDGGFKDYTLSEETRKKVSEANKGKTLSKETRNKISEANKGRTLPKEIRNKISEANKGKILSEETRKKVSEANKDKILSKETRDKLSKTHTLMYEGKKLVIHNLKQFCRENKLNYNYMRSVSAGKRKSYKGYTKHIEE